MPPVSRRAGVCVETYRPASTGVFLAQCYIAAAIAWVALATIVVSGVELSVAAATDRWATLSDESCTCGAAANVQGSLMALYDATSGQYWHNSTNWGSSSAAVCTWHGVSCDEGGLVVLGLRNNNLRGTLPAALSQLPVTRFDVRSNGITGNLPVEYSSWVNITVFDVGDNQLQGSLPTQYRLWSQLTQLRVGRNALTGSLASEFSALTTLTEVLVDGNALNGTLPPEFSNWTRLKVAYFHRNRFTGSIPVTYCRWVMIKTFSFENNQLSGTLPPLYAAFLNVEVFNVGLNRLSGTLPPEYASWSFLETFSLSNNRLAGILPTRYGNWSRLQYFSVYANALTGTLPPEYASWSFLETFWVSENSIAGTLPPQYANWLKLGGFWVYVNALVGTLPPGYASWSSVRGVSVRDNELTGTLPPEYGSWTLIFRFNASRNQLSGTLPESYKNWSVVEDFDVSRNHISGTLPPEYSNWIIARRVGLTNNTFVGTLPAGYSSWKVSTFELDGNSMRGTLPPEYASWTNLTTFSVTFNNLSGTVPPAYFTQWPQLQVFQVSNNRLTGTLPPECNASLLTALLLSDNDFVGSVPWQWAAGIRGPMQVLLLHNNPRLTGTLPAFPFDVTVVVSTCNTSLCGRLPARWRANALYFPLLACQALPTDFLAYGADIALLSLIVPANKAASPVCAAAIVVPTTTPPPRSLQPSSNLSLSVATGVRSFSDVGVAVACSVSTATGFSLRRATLMILVSCGGSDGVLPAVDWTNAPLQLDIGDDASSGAGRHRGAVVGNIVLWVLAVFVGTVAVLLYYRVRRSSTGQCSLPAAAATLRLPGALVVVVTLFLQQTMLSSVVVLSSSSDGGDTALDVGIGVLGITAVVAVQMVLLWVLDPRPHSFKAAGADVECASRETKNSGWRCLAYLVKSRVEWKSARGRGQPPLLGRYFVACFGVLFRGAALRRHWWTAADCGMSILICVVAGLQATQPTACRALQWVQVGLTGLWAGLAFWCRPKHRRLSCVNTIFSNIMTFVLALLTALSVDDETLGVLTLVGVYSSLVMTVVALAGSWWLSKKCPFASRDMTAPVLCVKTEASFNSMGNNCDAAAVIQIEAELAALVRLICNVHST